MIAVQGDHCGADGTAVGLVEIFGGGGPVGGDHRFAEVHAFGDGEAEAFSAVERDEAVAGGFQRARRGSALHDQADQHAAVDTSQVHAAQGKLERAEAGADLFLVQSQVSSAHHISTSTRVLSLSDLTGALKVPVLVGNTVSGEAAYQLMHQGAAGVFVGVGPGAACTTREVLGIGMPQVSATIGRPQLSFWLVVHSNSKPFG